MLREPTVWSNLVARRFYGIPDIADTLRGAAIRSCPESLVDRTHMYGDAGPGSKGPREMTLRALAAGGLIGALLAAGNVYTGLKIAYIDGGSITAALLGFAVFSIWRTRSPYTPLENNITQTTAGAAAVMGAVAGLAGPMPALELFGESVSALALLMWGLAVGTLGVLLGAGLRHRLIVEEGLPFPTGVATAELIRAAYGLRSRAMKRAGTLILFMVVAAAVVWLRDVPPARIPKGIFASVILSGGIAASSLGIGVSASPLVVGTGILMGVRNGVSVFGGAVVAWFVLAPWLVRSGIVPTPAFKDVVNWLLWPGVGLMVASALTSLALQWRSVLRSVRDLVHVGKKLGGPESSDAAPYGPRTLLVLGVLASGLVVAVGWLALGVSIVALLMVVVVSVVLAGVCGRAAGETDVAPVGSVGAVGQIAFGARSSITSLVAGSVPNGVGSQAAQILWAFRAGHVLGGSARAQLRAQLLGVVVGIGVAVPVYVLCLDAYGLGTESMPAPAALSWRATAEAVSGGSNVFPPHALNAMLLASGLGVGLTLLSRVRFLRPWLPSPIALGIAFTTPAAFAGAVAVGAMVLTVARSLRPNWAESFMVPIAAGAIAGESLMGVGVAALMSQGII